MKYHVTVVEKFYKILYIEADNPQEAFDIVSSENYEIGDDDWGFDGATISVAKTNKNSCPELLLEKNIKYYRNI